jgi:hypothetical protein
MLNELGKAQGKDPPHDIISTFYYSTSWWG